MRAEQPPLLGRWIYGEPLAPPHPPRPDGQTASQQIASSSPTLHAGQLFCSQIVRTFQCHFLHGAGLLLVPLFLQRGSGPHMASTLSTSMASPPLPGTIPRTSTVFRPLGVYDVRGVCAAPGPEITGNRIFSLKKNQGGRYVPACYMPICCVPIYFVTVQYDPNRYTPTYLVSF
jgi:hypothetical protein